MRKSRENIFNRCAALGIKNRSRKGGNRLIKDDRKNNNGLAHVLVHREACNTLSGLYHRFVGLSPFIFSRHGHLLASSHFRTLLIKISLIKISCPITFVAESNNISDFIFALCCFLHSQYVLCIFLSSSSIYQIHQACSAPGIYIA